MSNNTNWAHTWWPPIGDAMEAKPTITEFLLARIAEDEAVAREAIDSRGSKSSPDGRWRFEDVAYQGEWPRNPEPHEDDDPELITWSESKWALHANRHSPARALAECAAKRAIIEAAHWHPQERPSDTELHSRGLHPSYEYETTEGPRKQWDDADETPEGDGWERNTDRGYGQGWARLDYTEESYWRRLRPESERKEWKRYIPIDLLALAAIYSDHPDYQPAWSMS